MPKHVVGSVSSVFTFQCTFSWLDKFNLRIMDGTYKIKIFKWILKIAYNLWNCGKVNSNVFKIRNSYFWATSVHSNTARHNLSSMAYVFESYTPKGLQNSLII